MIVSRRWFAGVATCVIAVGSAWAWTHAGQSWQVQRNAFSDISSPPCPKVARRVSPLAPSPDALPDAPIVVEVTVVGLRSVNDPEGAYSIEMPESNFGVVSVDKVLRGSLPEKRLSLNLAELTCTNILRMGDRGFMSGRVVHNDRYEQFYPTSFFIAHR